MQTSLGGFLIALALGGAACSSPALSVSDYSDALEEATDAYISESQTLSAAFQSAVEDEVRRIIEEGSEDAVDAATEVTVTEMMLYLALLEDAMGRYLAVVEDMSVPGSLDDPHREYIGAYGSVHGSIPQTRISIEAAESLDEIQAAIASSRFQDGQLRLRAACSSLEGAVRSEGVGVDLGCDGGSVVP